MSKAKRIKGKKDYRDLTSDAQFYYEKLIQLFNDSFIFGEEIEENIGYLDNLIDAIRTSYEHELDDAYDRIDELEEKIEELE